jgi:hypothetical protein
VEEGDGRAAHQIVGRGGVVAEDEGGLPALVIEPVVDALLLHRAADEGPVVLAILRAVGGLLVRPPEGVADGHADVGDAILDQIDDARVLERVAVAAQGLRVGSRAKVEGEARLVVVVREDAHGVDVPHGRARVPGASQGERGVLADQLLGRGHRQPVLDDRLVAEERGERLAPLHAEELVREPLDQDVAVDGFLLGGRHRQSPSVNPSGRRGRP